MTKVTKSRGVLDRKCVGNDAQWFRTSTNRMLAHPLARSLAPLTRLLAPLRSLIRSLTHSLLSAWDWGICFTLSVLNHWAKTANKDGGLCSCARLHFVRRYAPNFHFHRNLSWVSREIHGRTTASWRSTSNLCLPWYCRKPSWFYRICTFSFLFLGNTKHLYKRVCPPVRPSVRPSVRRSIRPSVRYAFWFTLFYPFGAPYAVYPAFS